LILCRSGKETSKYALLQAAVDKGLIAIPGMVFTQLVPAQRGQSSSSSTSSRTSVRSRQSDGFVPVPLPEKVPNLLLDKDGKVIRMLEESDTESQHHDGQTPEALPRKSPSSRKGRDSLPSKPGTTITEEKEDDDVEEIEPFRRSQKEKDDSDASNPKDKDYEPEESDEDEETDSDAEKPKKKKKDKKKKKKVKKGKQPKKKGGKGSKKKGQTSKARDAASQAAVERADALDELSEKVQEMVQEESRVEGTSAAEQFMLEVDRVNLVGKYEVPLKRMFRAKRILQQRDVTPQYVAQIEAKLLHNRFSHTPDIYALPVRLTTEGMRRRDNLGVVISDSFFEDDTNYFVYKTKEAFYHDAGGLYPDGSVVESDSMEWPNKKVDQKFPNSKHDLIYYLLIGGSHGVAAIKSLLVHHPGKAHTKLLFRTAKLYVGLDETRILRIGKESNDALQTRMKQSFWQQVAHFKVNFKQPPINILYPCVEFLKFPQSIVFEEY